MRILRPRPASTGRLTLLAGALVLAVLSCGREVTAPVETAERWARGLSFNAVFPTVYQQAGGGSSGITFERVHIVLRRADGRIALDTTVLFPAGADSLPLSLSVPLDPGAPSSGEPLALTLGYVNAAGVTVFEGGPVTVTATPAVPGQAPPPPAQIPVRYTGPGASAARVVAAPRSLTVSEGQPFSFSAVATDAAGATIANTPIIWASLDPATASITAPAAGAGVAQAVRGTARIVAQLLTGPKDTVTVTVLLRARTLAVVSGNAQLGAVSAALAQPLVVKATAIDGVGVAGVSVTFAVATGGGAVGSATVTTDASGLASTAWTLGATAGAQSVTASSAGLTGSPLTFTATARSVAPVKLVFSAGPPASVAAGSVIGPVTVTALDAQGDVAKTFTGAVAIALGAGSPTGPLLGTTTATAVAGVATFADLKINVPGSGYLFAASASGLAGVNSDAFAVVPGPAVKLAFGSYPVAGAVAGAAIDAMSVIARDVAGNVATGFTGTVTLGLLEGPAGATMVAITAAAVQGVATFEGAVLTQAGSYRFTATATGVTAASGPAFTVVAGPAAMMVLINGGGQSANAGSPLARPITVGVTDRYGNPVYAAGRTISFAAGSGGSASPASGTTNAAGQVTTSWTLGGTAGTQTLSASSTGLPTLSVAATALGGSPSAGGELILIQDVNWGDGSYGLAMSGGSTYLNPGNAQFVKNLVGFTPSGSRANATKVLLLDDHGSGYNFSGYWSPMNTIITGQGYTTVQTSLHSDLASIPVDVKVVILVTPIYAFTVSEINGLKTFASQGGRILFVGEWGGYYASGYENTFLASMGATTTVTGSIYGCDAALSYGVPNVNTAANQLTTGIAATGAGSFLMACASQINLGANDFALMRDAGTNYVVAAIAKISLTLSSALAVELPVSDGMAAMQVQAAGESQIQKPGQPGGLPGASTTGPPPQ